MKRRLFDLGGLYFAKEMFAFVSHIKELLSVKELQQNVLVLVPVKIKRP